jgi:hypothetical protein
MIHRQIVAPSIAIKRQLTPTALGLNFSMGDAFAKVGEDRNEVLIRRSTADLYFQVDL